MPVLASFVGLINVDAILFLFNMLRINNKV